MGYRAASAALAPVLALQGRYAVKATPRLPEPAGPRAGHRGTGTKLRLLILGDSAAAGVGAASQDEALSGRLIGELEQSFRVSWTVIARPGATTAGTIRHLVRHQEVESSVFDVVVISLGGNDMLSRRPVVQWIRDIEEVVSLLRSQFGVRQILLSGMPPMHAFPAFPQPLRWYLGATARKFDAALERWAATQPDCTHVPLSFNGNARLLASDGFHPGPMLYAEWAMALAPRIRAQWSLTSIKLRT